MERGWVKKPDTAQDDDDDDDAIFPPPTMMSSPKPGETRKRNTSLLEKLRIRSRTTVERDTTPPRDDSYGAVAHGELMGLSLSLRIPFTQTGAGRNGAMKLFYIVRCTMARPEHAPAHTPTKSWEVAKKYSDFSRLDKTLKETLIKNFHSVEGAYGLALLPPRHLLTSDFDETVITERKAGFLQYLQSALTASFFFDDIQPILAIFLECPGSQKTGARLTRFDTSLDGDESERSPGTALKTTTAVGEAHHGFLYKHNGHKELFKPFRMVFCVLNYTEGMFRYYKPSHPILLGELIVKGVYGKVQQLEPKQFGIPASGYGFTVWMPHKELILYAESPEDRTHWMNAFKSLLSTVVPHAVAAMPVYVPRPPTQSVAGRDRSSSALSLGGSLIFSEESRRLSDTKSFSEPAQQQRPSNTGSLSREEQTTQPRPSLEALRMREAVDEAEARRRSSSRSPMVLPGAVIIAGPSPPSVLQSHTRDAIHASSQRRGRSASELVNVPGAEAAVTAALASAAAARAGEVPGEALPLPMTSPLAMNGPRSGVRDENDAEVGVRSHVEDDMRLDLESPLELALAGDKLGQTSVSPSHRQPRTSSLTMPLERPRFPSNISIESARPFHLLSEDSIRPPSNDPESTQLKTSNSNKSLMESSSWRKLPPPRFPSNLRIASSGGSSLPSPTNKSRRAAKKNGSSVKAHPFRIFMTSASSTRSLDLVEDDAVSGELFARALARLRLDSLPTRNPHVLLGLLSVPDPWKSRAVGLMSPHQFSACLENIYFDVHSLRKSAAFRPRQDDLIVTSVARAGATPVIFALDSLRLGQVTCLEDLPVRVPWIEGKELPGEATKVAVVAGGGGVGTGSARLLKTTLPLRYCLGIAGGQSMTSASPKVVVVLRDPLDLRLSWFRHCRRVYKKCSKKGKNFDDKFRVGDFAQVPIPSCNPTFSAAMSPNETYEVFLREVLQIHEQGKTQGHLHIIFYEELVADCENTIRKLAQFAYPAADEQLIRRIVDHLQDSPDFPGSYNEHTQRVRIGCVGHGHRAFKREDVDLIDDDWDKMVRCHFPHFDQYSQVYEHFLDVPYPHPRTRPFDEDLQRARKSSGLSAILMQPGRRSLMDLKVTKFVQRRLKHHSSSGSATGSSTPFETNSKAPAPAVRVLQKIDPDDTDEEDDTAVARHG